METIEVSVFCIAYNQKKYIRKAIDSLIMQKTSFNYEIIIHDDASTDGTSKIIKEYKHKYPKLIKIILEDENQYLQGISFWQKMLDLAKGKYIAFCEGDDFWVDEFKLQKQYEAFINNSNLSIVVGKVVCCDEDGTLIGRTLPDNKLGIVGDKVIKSADAIKLIFNYPFHTSSYCVLRKVYEMQLKRSFRNYVNGDQAIIFESLLEGDFYYIDEPLSCRRLNSIGSYNQRLKSFSFEKRMVKQIHFLYGCMYFDIELKKRFNRVIYEYICKRLPHCCCFEIKMFRDLRHYFNIRFKDIIAYSGVKNAFFYLLSIIFPYIAKKICLVMKK